MPALPDPHAIVVILFTGLTLYVFAKERIATETIALGVVLALVVMFQVWPYEDVRPGDFFANFGNEALITVCALMVLGKGLDRTGALQPVVTVLARAWLKHPRTALLMTLVLAASCSAFVNDTPLIVMLLPVLVACTLRAGRPTSSVLLPMGLGVLMGGMTTTIGTSTNLLAVGIANDLGVGPIGMFDFALPALAGSLIGLVYLWLIAPRLIPERKLPMADAAPRLFNAVLYVNEDSFAHGRTLAAIRSRTENRMRIQRIGRGEGLFVAKLPSVRLQAGDRLYVRDTADRLKEFERLLGATLYNADDVEHPVSDAKPLATEGQQLAEVVITRGSPLHHRTLNAAHFSSLYNLVPLAIHRSKSGMDVPGDPSETRLRSGDVLLVQGSRRAISTLRDSGSMLVLDGTVDLPHTERSVMALGIMGAVVAAAATGVLPIAVSALCGVAAMLATRCMQWRDIRGALSVPVIMLIVSSLSLGTAMVGTGAVDYIAEIFLSIAGQLPPAAVLSGLMLVSIVLTNIVSNNTIAVIGTPVAISIAHQLGLDPEPFVVALIFGANMSFCTPIGYQGNLLILSAGGYRFADFVRVGLPLTVLLWLAFTLILPVYYGV